MATSDTVHAICRAYWHGPGEPPICDPFTIEEFTVDLVEPLRAAILDRGAAIGWQSRVPAQHPHGWKSPIGILEATGKPGHAFREALLALITPHVKRSPHDPAVALQSWAMVNRSGAEHIIHTHAGVKTCGIYYLDDGGTATDFYANGVAFDSVVPRRGRLAVFSGSIPHGVRRISTEAERVTVAFNVLQ